MRDKNTIKRLNMYKSKVQRNSAGKVVSGEFISSSTAHKARIQPDRRWFGNTRVIGQKQMEAFREDLAEKVNDPYTVVLKQKSVSSLLK